MWSRESNWMVYWWTEGWFQRSDLLGVALSFNRSHGLVGDLRKVLLIPLIALLDCWDLQAIDVLLLKLVKQSLQIKSVPIHNPGKTLLAV